MSFQLYFERLEQESKSGLPLAPKHHINVEPPLAIPINVTDETLTIRNYIIVFTSSNFKRHGLLDDPYQSLAFIRGIHGNIFKLRI